MGAENWIVLVWLFDYLNAKSTWAPTTTIYYSRRQKKKWSHWSTTTTASSQRQTVRGKHGHFTERINFAQSTESSLKDKHRQRGKPSRKRGRQRALPVWARLLTGNLNGGVMTSGPSMFIRGDAVIHTGVLFFLVVGYFQYEKVTVSQEYVIRWFMNQFVVFVPAKANIWKFVFMQICGKFRRFSEQPQQQQQKSCSSVQKFGDANDKWTASFVSVHWQCHRQHRTCTVNVIQEATASTLHLPFNYGNRFSVRFTW